MELYFSENFIVAPIAKRDGGISFGLKRPGQKNYFDQFATWEFANAVALYCDTFHAGSYDGKARKAAKAYARKVMDMYAAADEVIGAGGPYPNGLPINIRREDNDQENLC